jgi:lysine-ketoglutarate reductase/saccharopine dehydrogenase-like protein (TIGR00300 family)
MVTQHLTLEGHLLDSHTLSEVLELLDRHGVAFKVKRFAVGEFADSPTIIDLHLTAPTLESMRIVLTALEPYGATYSLAEVQLATADRDGVLPEDFYSTTNFTTHVLHEGHRIEVENLEMDCGIRLWNDGLAWRAETCPMHKVRVGDQIVVGYEGVRVIPSETEQRDEVEFRFMGNDVSSERPKGRMIDHAAHVMRLARAEGKKTLLVGGPAIIHSGSARLLESLIVQGWVNVLFAGNALAAHDIESNMLGTSLGVDLSTGGSTPHGHTHHLRAINRVRRAGSIQNAVDQGLITGGVMHACIRHKVQFVLAGSIRDDGPLPDVITDNIAAQDQMRALVPGVGVCLMVATMLHSIATGNMLPATVKTFCVDADADTVIKLTDRGTHQAVGLVTDCEYFLKELCERLGALPK